MKRLKLEHGAVEVDSTPRRLVVRVADVASRQPDTSEKIRGPPGKVQWPYLQSWMVGWRGLDGVDVLKVIYIGDRGDIYIYISRQRGHRPR